jgi:hypothetical protein
MAINPYQDLMADVAQRISQHVKFAKSRPELAVEARSGPVEILVCITINLTLQ